ncbi:MAG TPA: diacylglycerol kinase family protein [Streptosporangiaceae bacterium]
MNGHAGARDGGPPAHSQPAHRPGRGPRWLARLAIAAALAVPVVLLLGGGLASVTALAIGVAGLVVIGAAAWWFVINRGVLRWLAGLVLVAVPATVITVYILAGLLWDVALTAALAGGSAVAGRAALRGRRKARKPKEYRVPPPASPFVIMNPRSGGGKVRRFALPEKAKALGARVRLLEGPGIVDVAALARQAADEGADLLGVAGGDGTQALIAGVAAHRDLPMMVISAGTRNHFALDLGLDRADPASCLDALDDGTEIRVDLGEIGGRTFVNNASFGAYARVVQSPAYRDDKAATALSMLPDLLTGNTAEHLRVLVDGELLLDGPQAILISNNPYETGDIAGLGRRTRLDRGVLGIVGVKVQSAAQAVDLLSRAERSRALTVGYGREVVIEADRDSVPVGIDGEAVMVPTPVRCVIRPGALRVRVPAHRPGVPQPRPRLDWAQLGREALTFSRPGSRPARAGGR